MPNKKKHPKGHCVRVPRSISTKISPGFSRDKFQWDIGKLLILFFFKMADGTEMQMHRVK